jgi:uncharacterized repeat protein (TIGR03803 family)
MSLIKVAQDEFAGWKNVVAASIFSILAAIASSAQTVTTLLQFDYTNGETPSALVQGFDGSFYGTTQSGGVNQFGTVFKVTSSGTLTTLHSFGGTPGAALALAANGDFYGPTNNGGTGLGDIFKITPGGKFSDLYDFCSLTGCLDGENPKGVVQARSGNLYGTTPYGGTDFLGTVYKLTQSGTLTTLHSFGGPDGSFPASALIQATNGNFYGTTIQGGSNTSCAGGGSNGCGTVFAMTPSGTLTTLHSFSGTDGQPGYGGALIEATDGNFYGTTDSGGTGTSPLRCPFGCGTVYRISPAGKFATLYNFCSQRKCSDGAVPNASLVQGTDGNFYGTTLYGGNSTGNGTLFKITPQGVLTTLYDFCTQQQCADGAGPEAALVQATDGTFYGTTANGGLNSNPGWGTIFRLSMGLGPFVKLMRTSGQVSQSGGILGQGFTGTTGVFLNGSPASFTVLSDTYIQAIVPAGATSGFVTVVTPTGTLTSNVVFLVGQ